ncbi:nitroreductase [Alsobacter sp. SYSU M60028]|uniref:Putative NAD(P)H nitroreductase n=1 Tax=Alsobacter ponti TaxID=2962936 RepID=A0ABT1LFY9_9HYPH|nr:nitroreductase [Alsobacter ponti]MCP8940354.1 nitroreductase [Alsobacter ponti]
MTDTLTLLKTRRSVPPIAMTGPAPTPAELDAILSVAARVPDHGKLAPWRFIVIEGDARLKLGDAIAEIFVQDNPDAGPDRIEVERKRLALAPLVVAVVSTAAPHVKIPMWEQEMSAGAACMNFVIAANALGFATSWLTGWMAYDRRFLDRLGLAGHERLAGLIHVGRGKPPEDRVRPVLADIVTRWSA